MDSPRDGSSSSHRARPASSRPRASRCVDTARSSLCPGSASTGILCRNSRLLRASRTGFETRSSQSSHCSRPEAGLALSFSCGMALAAMPEASTAAPLARRPADKNRRRDKRLELIRTKRSLSRSVKAEPESMYPETTAFKSTRPSGSGDPEQNSTGHSYSGSALATLLYRRTIVCQAEMKTGGSRRAARSVSRMLKAYTVTGSAAFTFTGVSQPNRSGFRPLAIA